MAVLEELKEGWDVGHLETAYLAYRDAVCLPSRGSCNLQR